LHAIAEDEGDHQLWFETGAKPIRRRLSPFDPHFWWRIAMPAASCGGWRTPRAIGRASNACPVPASSRGADAARMGRRQSGASRRIVAGPSQQERRALRAIDWKNANAPARAHPDSLPRHDRGRLSALARARPDH
jgi:hypothetical protein